MSRRPEAVVPIRVAHEIVIALDQGDVGRITRLTQDVNRVPGGVGVLVVWLAGIARELAKDHGGNLSTTVLNQAVQKVKEGADD